MQEWSILVKFIQAKVKAIFFCNFISFKSIFQDHYVYIPYLHFIFTLFRNFIIVHLPLISWNRIYILWDVFTITLRYIICAFNYHIAENFILQSYFYSYMQYGRDSSGTDIIIYTSQLHVNAVWRLPLDLYHGRTQNIFCFHLCFNQKLKISQAFGNWPGVRQ